MPGSMLILTWLGIIFVIILHRAIYGNFMHSSVPRQRLFLVAVPITSRYLFTRIYNATETL